MRVDLSLELYLNCPISTEKKAFSTLKRYSCDLTKLEMSRYSNCSALLGLFERYAKAERLQSGVTQMNMRSHNSFICDVKCFLSDMKHIFQL